MVCEKCHSSQMERVKVFRLSGCLVAAGFALLAMSLLAIPFALILAAAGTKGTIGRTSSEQQRAKAEAIARLERIPGLPPSVLTAFRRDGMIREETMQAIPLEQRMQIRNVMIDYHSAVASVGVAGAVVGGVGTAAVVILLLFGIPGTIIGLLLVRRKRLWRCAACGFAFERT